jgi:hypothetical protein
VGDVADTVRALRVDLREVACIRCDCRLVRCDRVVVASHPHIDVCWHVKKMTRGRHEMRKGVGARQRALGMRRSLPNMDSVMVCACVPRLERDRSIEQRENLGRPRSRLPVCVPPVVRMQIQKRFGGQRGDFRIARPSSSEDAHALGIRGLIDDVRIAGMPCR